MSNSVEYRLTKPVVNKELWNYLTELDGFAGTSGLPVLGSALQVLRVNAAGTGLEYAAPAAGGVTSVGLVGTANQITVTGASPITTSGSWTLSIASSAQLSIAKLTNLTSNGFVKTSGSDGTLSVDTATYLTSATAVTSIAKAGSTALVGAVTLTGGSGVTLTQVGQDISIAASGGSGATAALDNLASVSINTSLLAQTGVDLGGTTKPFRDLYLFGSGTYATTYIKLTGTPTGTRTLTLPNVTDTVAVLGTAQTFSAVQTFVTPVLGVAGATSLGITGTAGAGFISYPTQSSVPTAPASGYIEYADSAGRRSWIRASDGFTRTWDATLTANRVYALPDATTTIAGLSVAQTFTAVATFVAPVLGDANATSLTLSGNISATAWTTSGLRLKGVAATLTDTTSSGTVAAAYTDVLGGNTINSTSATTFTDYYTLFLKAPVQGTATLTNKWALGVESLKVTGIVAVNGAAGTYKLDVLSASSASDTVRAKTSSTGNNAYAAYVSENSLTTTMSFGMTGSAYSGGGAGGIFTADTAFMYTGSATGLTIVTANAAAVIKFAPGGSTERWRMTAAGTLVSAISANASVITGTGFSATGSSVVPMIDWTGAVLNNGSTNIDLVKWGVAASPTTGSGSKLLNLYSGATSVFSVGMAGGVATAYYKTTKMDFGYNSTIAFTLTSDSTLKFGNTTDIETVTADFGFKRNAAGVGELNNGTAGTITGDLKLRNLLVQAGGLLSMTSTGGAPVVGTATLTAGTVTVSTTAAVTGTKIFIQRKSAGGTIGMAITYTISSGTSFTINSDNPLDTSTFDWHFVGAL